MSEPKPKFEEGETFEHDADGLIEIKGFYVQEGGIMYECIYHDEVGNPVSPLSESEVEEYLE